MIFVLWYKNHSWASLLYLATSCRSSHSHTFIFPLGSSTSYQSNCIWYMALKWSDNSIGIPIRIIFRLTSKFLKCVALFLIRWRKIISNVWNCMQCKRQRCQTLLNPEMHGIFVYRRNLNKSSPAKHNVNTNLEWLIRNPLAILERNDIFHLRFTSKMILMNDSK